MGRPSTTRLPRKGRIRLVPFKDWDDLGYKLQLWARTPEADIPAILTKSTGWPATTTNGKPTGRVNLAANINGRPAQARSAADSTPSTPAAAETEFDTAEAPAQPRVPPAQLALAQKLARRFQA